MRYLGVELDPEQFGPDAIDGTPVVGIKPVMSGFLPQGELAEPDWARELMRGYGV